VPETSFSSYEPPSNTKTPHVPDEEVPEGETITETTAREDTGVEEDENGKPSYNTTHHSPIWTFYFQEYSSYNDFNSIVLGKI
jgi:hypothetical protein